MLPGWQRSAFFAGAGAGGEACRWSGKIDLSSRQDQIFSSEGVDILPVKPNVMANFEPYQYVCSTLGSRPVMIKHISISRALRATNRLARTLLVLALVLSAAAALAQSATASASV